MSDITTTIDTYLEAYGETDPSRRKTLIEQCWSPSGTLVDPPMEATGHTAIDTMFAAVQGQFPGHSFRRTSVVDAHHGVARYGWDLIAPDGAVTLNGTDFAHIGDNHLLKHVTGFFGPLTPTDT